MKRKTKAAERRDPTDAELRRLWKQRGLVVEYHPRSPDATLEGLDALAGTWKLKHPIGSTRPEEDERDLLGEHTGE